MVFVLSVTCNGLKEVPLMISVFEIIAEIQDRAKGMKLIHNCDQFMKILYGKNDKIVIMVKLKEDVRWSKQRDIEYHSHTFLKII